MKTMVNTTTLVYFSQVKPDFLSKIEVSTIRAVAVELAYLIGGAEAKELLAGIDVVQASRLKL